MTWRAYLGLTMTGEVGAQLDWSSGSLSVSINEIEDLSATVTQASLDGVGRHWWSPLSGALLLSWEGPQGEVLMGAGPLVEPPAEEQSHQRVGLKAQGIGAILAQRPIPGDFGPGEEDQLKATTLEWSGVSLGSLVGRIVGQATSKRVGWLPIVVPAEVAADRQRTYEGWNLGNNMAWKRIVEITEVIGGPDVAFRPRFVPGSNRTRFEWVLVTGTEAQPSIAQTSPILWDTTSDASCVASVALVSSAAGLAHRVYATGTGQGAGIALAIAESAPPQYVPLIEAVIADSDAEGELLRARAEAALSTAVTDQLNLGIASEGQGTFGTWQVGDTADVQVQGWLGIPDGTWPAKIIGASYTLGSRIATVKTQPAVYGKEWQW